MREFEDKRILLTHELADKLGLDKSKVKLKQIAELMEPEKKTELLEIKQELENLLIRVKHANRVNELITKGSLTYIHKTMEILSGEPAGQGSYNKSGSITQGKKRPMRFSSVA